MNASHIDNFELAVVSSSKKHDLRSFYTANSFLFSNYFNYDSYSIIVSQPHGHSFGMPSGQDPKTYVSRPICRNGAGIHSCLGINLLHPASINCGKECWCCLKRDESGRNNFSPYSFIEEQSGLLSCR